MTEWTMIRWHGSPEAAATALRGLGWRGPEEPPAETIDPRIGGFIPEPGLPIRVIDGTAFVAFAANQAIETPGGLAATGPELSAALIGSF